MDIKINSMNLCVKNMSRAVIFYEMLLNQSVTERDDTYSVFEINGFRLGLFAYEKMKEAHAYGDKCIQGLEVENIAIFQEKLTEKGCKIVFPLAEIGDHQMLEFEDSEGNHIEVTSFLKNRKAALAKQFWNDIDTKKWECLKQYFTSDACIEWPNTKERFNVDGFIEANSHYPGSWSADIERIAESGSDVITVVRVWLPGESDSFHVVSFFEWENGKIRKLTEYWGDDGEPPQWRKKMRVNIGF